MSLPLNQIIQGDAFEVLKGFPKESIDMVMFSPPYWGLRDYKIPKVDDVFAVGGLGLENHPKQYINRMVVLGRLLKRVLKKSGSLWINLGDTYFASGGQYEKFNPNRKEIVNDYKQPKVPHNNAWLQPKQKLLIPERCAIALQEDGWILRNDIIWHKPNHMPSSVKDRLTTSWEHLYFFVKSKRYFFDLDAIRQPHKIGSEAFNYRVGDSKKKFQHGAFQFKASEQEIKDYEGKFEGFAEESEKFGSPRARNERKSSSKFLETNTKTASPGARGLLALKEGKLTTHVKQKILDVGAYLKNKRRVSGCSFDELAEMTGITQTTLEHYFRTDFSGQALPDRGTWEMLKPILGLGEYDDFINEEIRSALPQPHPLGKNPSDTIEDEMKQEALEKGYTEHSSSRLITGLDTKHKHGIEVAHPLGKSPEDFWSLTTQPFKGAHFAVYPERLCENPIKAACPKEGIVLDPMCGSGTTLLVARKLCRNYIGIELNPSYVEMARKRLAQIPERIDTFNMPRNIKET